MLVNLAFNPKSTPLEIAKAALDAAYKIPERLENSSLFLGTIDISSYSIREGCEERKYLRYEVHLSLIGTGMAEQKRSFLFTTDSFCYQETAFDYETCFQGEWVTWNKGVELLTDAEAQLEILINLIWNWADEMRASFDVEKFLRQTQEIASHSYD